MLSGELDSKGEAADHEIAQMDHDGDADGLARFVARIHLEESGPWGYTVRVVPRHPLLTSVADLGLVAQA
jgi:starch phosphorylase